MWVPVLLACSIWGNALSQDNNANSLPVSRAQWGWQMSQTGPGTIGHYFVRLPESEQQVHYVADGSGYHGTVAVTTSDQQHVHTTNFALGERAIELNSQVPNTNQNTANNGSQLNGNNRQQLQSPVDIYLLQQQYPMQGQIVQITPNTPQNFLQFTSLPNFYYTANTSPKQIYYNENIDHRANNKDNSQISNENTINKSIDEANDEIIETKENGPVVRVFKDHNCPNDDNKETHVSKLQKTSDIIAHVPTYKEHNVHSNFGVRDRPTYQRDSNYNVNSNDRSQRFYYSTEISHPTTDKPISYTAHEGISRLVASTQDLISNEDLLRINHAAERTVNSHSDDIIKPKRRTNSRTLNFNYYRPEENPRNRITVSAKYGNIEESKLNQPQIVREQNFQTETNEYKFASPIVVDDTNYGSYKQRIVNNLMSTMVPYIENGYEIIDVRNNIGENNTYSEENKSDEDLVNITPRPISQKYLAPITVALRLFNSNDTNIFNSVDDHETSDSEFIENKVKNPRQDKTIVEIQESIPVEITHINEVEYHEYLDEGRSNQENPLGLVKSLYQKYLDSLDASRNNQNTYQNTNSQQNDYNENNNQESQEPSESSENKPTEVQEQASSDNRNSYANYYNTDNKIIQPIIIEKQVPVTTYVDRFFEKKVPYPEPVEVVKQVPVDRPVPVPVHYETIVEKPVEVTRYVDKPFPVEVLKPYPVEVRVPYPVEHKVYVDRPVHVPYPVEKVVEKQLIHHIPVPTPIGIPVGIHVPVEKKVLYPVAVETPVPVAIPIEKPVPYEKIVEKEVPVPYPVEKKVPYPVRHEVKVPVPYPVEKRVPYPVEKIVEKPVTVTKVVEKHIKVPVPHPVRVEVPRPYPVDRIVEKKVPYPVHVDRIVERKVPVQVPYPVKTVVEKIVEKPVVVTKYIDKPYPVEKRVPYPVEKIVERKVPYSVHVPVEVKVPYVVERNTQKPPEPYQFEKVEPTTLYSYGITQEALSNVANYLRHQQEQYKQPIPNYLKSNIDNFGTQQQAESQRNYQIQLANAQLLKNLQNATPVHSTHWSDQYASSYNYLNSTTDSKNPSRTNSRDNFKYYGPPPLKNYNNEWENNKDYSERIRRTDRTPKMTNLRIEYGGFKPPLIPSTEVDLDGVPINKKE
ncbi:uncharacterized protein LOC126778380 [Nymphalis io]|uniref:uncharacterized protein LOC126778380 n=1 Tax=Inachis io TaxID=171585 RepID=UPI0021697B76|nr:uncharacterized protein LOC126778380 [Nymphalis io]